MNNGFNGDCENEPVSQWRDTLAEEGMKAENDPCFPVLPTPPSSPRPHHMKEINTADQLYESCLGVLSSNGDIDLYGNRLRSFEFEFSGHYMSSFAHTKIPMDHSPATAYKSSNDINNEFDCMGMTDGPFWEHNNIIEEHHPIDIAAHSERQALPSVEDKIESPVKTELCPSANHEESPDAKPVVCPEPDPEEGILTKTENGTIEGKRSKEDDRKGDEVNAKRDSDKYTDEKLTVDDSKTIKDTAEANEKDIEMVSVPLSKDRKPEKTGKKRKEETAAVGGDTKPKSNSAQKKDVETKKKNFICPYDDCNKV